MSENLKDSGSSPEAKRDTETVIVLEQDITTKNLSSPIPLVGGVPNTLKQLQATLSWDALKALDDGNSGAVIIGNNVYILDPNLAGEISELEKDSSLALRTGKPVNVAKGDQVRKLGEFTGNGKKDESESGVMTRKPDKKWSHARQVFGRSVGEHMDRAALIHTMAGSFNKHFGSITVGEGVNFDHTLKAFNLDLILTQITGLQPDELTAAIEEKIRSKTNNDENHELYSKEKLLKNFLGDFRSGVASTVLPSQLNLPFGIPDFMGKKPAAHAFASLLFEIALESGRDSAIMELAEKTEEITTKTGEKVTRQIFSEAEILANIQEMIAAGHETTAAHLNATLGLVFQDPLLLEELRKEIENIDIDDPVALTAFMKEGTKTLLGRVLTEGLRLYPVIPNIPVKAKKRLVFKNQKGETMLVIKRGMNINVVLPVVNKRAASKLSGSDPDLFDPSRFVVTEEMSQAEIDEMNQEIISFWAGPHQCVGRNMATTTSYYAAIRFLRETKDYDMKLSERKPSRFDKIVGGVRRVFGKKAKPEVSSIGRIQTLRGVTEAVDVKYDISRKANKNKVA